MKKLDLTGHIYSRLTVLSEASKKGRDRRWLCQCICGTTCKVHHTSLRSGNTRSCGCLRKEVLTTHGDSQGNRLYGIWRDMKARCLDPKQPSYSNYGGRGITVCDAWLAYPEFKVWALENGYSDELTIDRIENEAGYAPDNCTWATWSTQMRNKRKMLNVSSKYIGVSFYKSRNQWESYVQDQGKRKKLGYFEDEVSAAKARDNYIIINNLSGYNLNFK